MCSQNVLLFSEPQRRHLVQIKFATKGSYIDARDPAVALSIKNWVNVNLSVYTLGEFISFVAVNCAVQQSQ